MSNPPPLALRVQASLFLPSCRVGCRMRPERELAQTFGISRRKVREAIDHLVEAQILVREHGSGVYVRKIPRGAAWKELADPPPFEDLFISPDENEGKQRLRISTVNRSLKLEAWWISAFNNRTATLFKKGLSDQAEELGHQVAFRELNSGREAQRVASRLLSAMTKEPKDGYIIHVPFAQACGLIDTLMPAPVIYASTGTQPLEHQPMIRFDGAEMGRRAIRLLAAQGYRRIALLGFRPDHSDSDEGSQEAAYIQTLRKLKLSYRSYQRITLDEREISNALAGVLGEGNACDAIYLSDDYLLHAALPIIEKMGYRPGENLGMIVVSNRGAALPEGYAWSRIEYDPYNAGKLTVSSLIRSIESAGEELLSFSHHPAWCPGQTHLAPALRTQS